MSARSPHLPPIGGEACGRAQLGEDGAEVRPQVEGTLEVHLGQLFGGVGADVRVPHGRYR